MPIDMRRAEENIYLSSYGIKGMKKEVYQLTWKNFSMMY